MRINKFIASTGYCSRREADQFIEQGRVTVNGADCLDFGAEIKQGDRVSVDGDILRVPEEMVYIALHKPSGITSTTDRSDPTNIVDFAGHKVRIFPIGRLDKASEGLIFMTNDGDIVNKILRAGNEHQKEYVVTVDRPITDEFLDRMAKGVKIDTGERTMPCQVRREGQDVFRITLTQGLNRQIRRMCEALRYDVRKLVRVRIMDITLSGIERGKWRNLTPAEVAQLKRRTESSSKTAIFVPDKRKAVKPNPKVGQKVTPSGARNAGAKNTVSRNAEVKNAGVRNTGARNVNKNTKNNKKNGNNSRFQKRNVY